MAWFILNIRKYSCLNEYSWIHVWNNSWVNIKIFIHRFFNSYMNMNVVNMVIPYSWLNGSAMNMVFPYSRHSCSCMNQVMIESDTWIHDWTAMFMKVEIFMYSTSLYATRACEIKIFQNFGFSAQMPSDGYEVMFTFSDLEWSELAFSFYFCSKVFSTKLFILGQRGSKFRIPFHSENMIIRSILNLWWYSEILKFFLRGVTGILRFWLKGSRRLLYTVKSCFFEMTAVHFKW